MAVFSLFLENKAAFQKSGKLKQLKSSYLLPSSACALRVNKYIVSKPV